MNRNANADVKGNTFYSQDQNDCVDEQHYIIKQHQNHSSHNPSFFLRGDRDGSRQRFEGLSQEEDEQGEGEEEKDEEWDGSDDKRKYGEENREAGDRNNPDHNTDQHRRLDAPIAVVPKWPDDD